MSEFTGKHFVKIQIAGFITVLLTVITFSMKAQATVSDVGYHETRITALEGRYENLATKQDIANLKSDLKDYINKK